MLRQRDSYNPDDAVLTHWPLARHLAARYARGDRQQLEELEQVAALGLVQAAQRFDPERGTAFSTFAVPTIVGELRRHFRSTRWSVHVPRQLQEDFLAARRAEDEMTAEDCRSPSAAALAGRLGWTVEAVLEARSAAGALTAVSIDGAPADDEGAPMPLSERLGADDPEIERTELRDELDAARSTLDPEADEALRLRFEEELSFDEVADRIGTSPSHASKLVRRALDTLGSILSPQPQA